MLKSVKNRCYFDGMYLSIKLCNINPNLYTLTKTSVSLHRNEKNCTDKNPVCATDCAGNFHPCDIFSYAL